MAITLATAVASDMADAVIAAASAGAGAPTLKVYTGSKPANVETAVTGTLLATFTLTDPAAAAAAAGVATFDFDPDISATVAADGTAGYFRIADSDGTGVLDGTVGTSGADFNVSSTTWTTGGLVSLTAGTLTQPTS